MTSYDKFLIGGEWVSPRSSRTIDVRNASTGEFIGSVEGYIAKGIRDGARLVTGGGRPKGLDRGWFVEPTIFADVDNKSTIAQEEIFGPGAVDHRVGRRGRCRQDRQRVGLRPRTRTRSRRDRGLPEPQDGLRLSSGGGQA